jgi:hypothetical protein
MTAPLRKRELWYRRAAVLGAVAVTAAGIGLRDLHVFAARPHSAAAATCSVASSAPAPSALDITASGLDAGTLYSIWMTQPDGSQVGATTSSDSAGALSFTGFTAYSSGTYSVTITKFKGNSAVAACSGSVG